MKLSRDITLKTIVSGINIIIHAINVSSLKDGVPLSVPGVYTIPCDWLNQHDNVPPTDDDLTLTLNTPNVVTSNSNTSAGLATIVCTRTTANRAIGMRNLQ